MATIDYAAMLDAAKDSHANRIGAQHSENEKKVAEAIRKAVDTAETNRRRIDAGFGDSSPLPTADADDKESDPTPAPAEVKLEPVAVTPPAAPAPAPAPTPMVEPTPVPTTPTPVVVVAPVTPAPSTTTTTRKSWYRVDDWSGWQKVAAIVGLFVGFIVGMNTYDWANFSLVGDWALVFNIVWVILVTLFGFFFFGWAFGFIANWLNPNTKVVEETTTTATTSAPAGAS